MKLPAKIEYAYKAVIELALRYQGEVPVQIHLISLRQNIPEKFLVQLLLRLKNARIVNSARGVAGGYYLTRPPSQISFADVIGAIDGTIFGATQEKLHGKVSDEERLLAGIWNESNLTVKQKLETVTFDQLISRLKKEEVAYQI